ncbi:MULTISPECIES: hypothetical protein [Oxalobacteraceae]|jgi:uncharacterized protein YceK|uniref:hypothetical protein n=1 Tax=Oxalobacteraceae TaxID=75682 RepID=UPI001455DBE8|nr:MULTISPECIES: hypothetical protein [Oxalobacteraceae]
MKSLMITVTVALLAGCSGMGMHRDTSGSSGTTGAQSGASGNADYYQRDDGFHSWIN